MPEIKSHRGLTKRIKQTGSGRLRGNRTYTSHRSHGRTRKQKRHLRESGTVHSIDCERTKEMLVK